MRIAVYCSSKDNIAQSYKDTAAMIGSYIGNNRHTLVYGGIASGLMEITASAVHKCGGRVVGIVPITRKERSCKLNDENVLVCDLNERKAKMIMMSDVFVVLPGGYGTLDELISTFSLLTFTGDLSKRIIVVNSDNLFDPVMTQLKLMAERGFMPVKHLSRMVMVANGMECCEVLADIVKQPLNNTI